MLLRFAALAATAALTSAQTNPPTFRAEDVRPQGAAKPHLLSPGLGVWIFGNNLAASPGCTAANVMDPATYRTELCGTRVLFGGMEAKLIFVSPAQINLVTPDYAWENELVSVQVIRDDAASTPALVRFGWSHPVISLAGPAYAGMPVWVHIDMPYGKGWIRYPFWSQPWDMGAARFEVRFEDAELPRLPLSNSFSFNGMTVGLPHEVPQEYLNRLPLHLVYRLDRPGNYQVRYTTYRYKPGSVEPIEDQQTPWTDIVILPSPAARPSPRTPPRDTVELLCDYLPNLLARRDAATLLQLAPYLDSRDSLIQQYAGYALNYFDPVLVDRLLSGRKPAQRVIR